MSSSVIGALRVNLGLDSATFSEGLAKAQKSLKGFGASMMKVGAGLSAAVTTPLVAIGKGMIDAASDAAESASAFDFLFKDQKDNVRAWADEMAKSIGRSTYALQDQALAFQQYFSQVAPTNEKAAELSKTFTALSQDLASFYNVSEDDALQKLRSGLAGEAEPLRAFGVFLSAAAVEAKAVEMGLKGANNELTEQEKVLARAAVIMEQTTAAQGDAARTAGSYANQQKALSAAIQDLGIKLGTILLPVAQKVTVALTGIVNWFSQLSPATQEWIVIAGGIAAALGPALIALGSLALIVGTLGAPVLAVVAAVAALTAAFIAFQPEIMAAYNAMMAWASNIGQSFAAMWQGIKDGFNAGIAALQALPARMMEIGGQIIDGLLQGLRAKWESVKAWFSGLADAIPQWVREKMGIHSPSRVMHEIGLNITQGLANGMAEGKGTVESVAGTLGDGIEGVFSGIGSSIAEAIKGTKSWKDVALDALSSVAQFLIGKMSFGGGWFGGLLKSLLGGLAGFANGGSFQVGGAGGIDSQIVAFRASPNETVNVTKPGQTAGGGMHITFGLASDGALNIMPEVVSVSRREAANQTGRLAANIPAMVDQRNDTKQYRRLRPAMGG